MGSKKFSSLEINGNAELFVSGLPDAQESWLKSFPSHAVIRGVLREHSDLYTTNKFGNDVSPFDPKLDTSESASSAANIFRVGENERLQ
uniref:Uncharacterized protein n=1 Tax=Vespula pensylvanica TaxID=30213 RepID=A0A834P8G9_VESPE|nr:hypothetical protein H0235_004892 [Vespula pensylvanica]